MRCRAARVPRAWIAILAAIAACALPLLIGGCSEQTAHAAVPVALTPVPAPTNDPVMNVAPDTSAMPPAQPVASPPTLSAIPAKATPTVDLPPGTPGPAPPKRPAPTVSKPEDEPATHPEPLQILPQLSAHDQAVYEQQTNEDISIAEKNLQQASGKKLSAEQQDLVEKVHSFVTQARDASKQGDWSRAKNLAQEAHLLSTDLVKTF